MSPPTAPELLLRAAGRVPVVDRGDPDGWRDAATRIALAEALARGDTEGVTALAVGYDTLLLLAPVGPGGAASAVSPDAVGLRSVGNAERRHRGAFSTPPDFADALARRAMPDPGAVISVVDPACGAGALLRATLKRALSQGFTAEAAASMLHGVDADPIAVELCRASLAAGLVRAGHPGTLAEVADLLTARIVLGDALMGPTPSNPDVGGFSWHAAFPDVLATGDGEPEPVTGWRGGFGAVLANPPWERLKVHARDWSGAPPPGLRDERAELARALRAGGRHPLTGTGELNAYLPFVETCWRLLAPGGRAAVLVPAGVASDRSAARLIEELVAVGGLSRIQLFEPETPVFAGVSARVAVAILELRGRSGFLAGSGDADPPRMAVGLTSPDADITAGADPDAGAGDCAGSGADVAASGREFALTPELLRVVNPNTATTPLFSSAADAALVTAVHRRVPILLRRGADAGPVADPDGWGLRLVTSLHMTRDARWFRTAPGPGLVPLWEAKHCGLLDPFGGGAREHRYWVPAELMFERHPQLCERGWLAGYRNVSTAGSPRTLLPAPLPVAGVGNSLPLIDARRLPLLLAALSSLPVDYLLRQKHAGANVNFFKLEQVPVPRPAAYDVPAPWAGSRAGPGPAGRTVADWMLERLARAVIWPATGLEALAQELGLDRCPVTTPPEDVLLARAEIDAAHAVLLGFSRPELAHALTTFGALREREVKATGRFGTAERVLAAYDRLG